MCQNEYEALLIAANLAQRSKSGFTIKPKEWRAFLAGSHFTVVEGISECKIEFENKRLNFDSLNNGSKPCPEKRSWAYVIRVGIAGTKSPRN
jgi:hypothetical protein